MKIIKSFLVGMLVIGLVFGGLVGCGGDESVNTEKNNAPTTENTSKKYEVGNEISFTMSAELLKDFSGSENSKIKLEKYTIVKITDVLPGEKYYKVEVVEPKSLFGIKGWVEERTVEVKSHICTSEDYEKAKKEFSIEVQIADSKPAPKTTQNKTSKTTSKPAETTKPKVTSNYYSDKIISCNLPANWEGDFLDCYEYVCESELSTPPGTVDFDVAIGIYNNKDLLDYGSIEAAIIVDYNEGQGYEAYDADGCYIKDLKYGNNNYKGLFSDYSGNTIYHYYKASGNDFYYIQIWIEDQSKVDEVKEVLANLKFKDL